MQLGCWAFGLMAFWVLGFALLAVLVLLLFLNKLSDSHLILFANNIFRWPTSGGATSGTRPVCLSVCI